MAEATRFNSESYWHLVWRKFRKNKPGLVGSFMVIILIALAVFSDFFAPTDPMGLNMRFAYRPPQKIHFFDNGKFTLQPFTYGLTSEYHMDTGTAVWSEDTNQRFNISFFVKGFEYSLLGIPMNIHLYGVEQGGHYYALGADKMGRDMWARMCRGARISLTMALLGTGISIIVGAWLGIMSGYFGGVIDLLMQRFTEFMQSFPQLPLWMALAAIIPRSWSQMMIFVVMSLIFALLSWPMLCRELRGKVIAMSSSDMILAAREMGASHQRIIFHHLFPNNFSHIIVVMSLTVPNILLAESFLSYLGIGVQEPLVSWGLLMRDAQTIETLGSHPWIMLPVLFIMISVLGFNFFGDGLRDGADPYTQH
ncbi:ABC transporter permease [Leadbettera azotonutricia]|uniref:Oligopeptide transport system permease protein AppC n=1 Tax=Leadbettera azotonutricia (strain ATCC BAA-888 / DSM 13862 / ZAS-9) TaxID=545695 RepID=F5Y7E7_LEAAZ|nr:ABC transporter permease [Leadbettera azotonutricia]AEF81352.1 oligopeptide transport system permease protein AppC [Leadbettera azotonutricia ZAS-9]